MSIKRSWKSRIFDGINVCFFVILGICMIYPFWNVFVTSLTTMGEYYAKPFILWPEQPTLMAYNYILKSDKLLTATAISVFITVTGTVYNVFITAMLAYGLSKKYVPGRNIVLILITIPMFFSGGLIPYFLLIRALGLMDNILVLILPGGVSVWNFVVMKSFFHQLPASMEESAKLDGANDVTIFFRIVVPLSKALLATFTLFAAVGIWNAWFDASIFLQNRKLHPLTLVLRQMLGTGMGGTTETLSREIMDNAEARSSYQGVLFTEGLKMATIIVATLPILIVYPWLQKYFTKGIMIGSVKG